MDRINFLSAGATRRRQNYQPEPRPQTALQRALIDLRDGVRLMDQPAEPRYRASPDDIEAWADHVEHVLRMAARYTSVAVERIGHTVPGGAQVSTDAIDDVAADLVGELRKIAGRLRE